MSGREQRFELTEEHMVLLRRANIRFDPSIEWGGPAFDFKRPFGNGNLYDDMNEILGGHGLGSLPASRRARYERLYHELGTALQVVLATGSFEPGLYEAPRYSSRWERVT